MICLLYSLFAASIWLTTVFFLSFGICEVFNVQQKMLVLGEAESSSGHWKDSKAEYFLCKATRNDRLAYLTNWLRVVCLSCFIFCYLPSWRSFLLKFWNWNAVCFKLFDFLKISLRKSKSDVASWVFLRDWLISYWSMLLTLIISFWVVSKAG